MSEEPIVDDQSHYEVSLTAGQAFLAFVLLLLSLAASFAFGLMIGKGQGDDRLLAQSSPSLVDEAGVVTRKPKERIVELGVADDASFEPAEVEKPVKTAPPVTIKEEPMAPEPASAMPPAQSAAQSPAPAKPAPVSTSAGVPHYAQLLSTGDQKKAESLAAKLIDSGFMGAYVERTTNEKGPLFRVRVNFPSEEQARTAAAKLRSFSKDVWITKQ